jgi:hypothetical protein
MADIGDIRNVRRPPAQCLRGPEDQVSSKEGSEIPDVGVRIDRRTASVEPQMVHFYRLDGLDASCERIVDSERLLGHEGLHSTQVYNAELYPPAGVKCHSQSKLDNTNMPSGDMGTVIFADGHFD